ncbi:MAG: fumarylacetoacetate hydrolase family protein [Planctomycetales bacterium]|nr:fumarylacetoacetate hydrolase family protein [Planctomycetales bacterium]
MKLAKFSRLEAVPSVGIVRDDVVVPLCLPAGEITSLFDILESNSPAETAESLIDHGVEPLCLRDVVLLAPVDDQEVWAAGVTYKRSQTARMEESEAAASCYDRVYSSPRPELFFKATPHRVVGPGRGVRIRADSLWNVPEPEITLVLSSHLKIVGFTIGNDMSSRDIEGENPLYLPQAKVYDECCALGPWISLTDEMPALDQIEVNLEVVRQGARIFAGETHSGQMARRFDDLVEWLGRDATFPRGAFLLTGTGIVPDSDFTLHPNDIIRITIAGVGTLENHVKQAP